jgi:hypothetical protein
MVHFFFSRFRHVQRLRGKPPKKKNASARLRGGIGGGGDGKGAMRARQAGG